MWVPGHSGIELNECADALAREGLARTYHKAQTALLAYQSVQLRKEYKTYLTCLQPAERLNLNRKQIGKGDCRLEWHLYKLGIVFS